MRTIKHTALAIVATALAFLFPSRSRHVNAGKIALIGTVFTVFFLFTAGFHFPGGASHFPDWAEAIVRHHKLPPVVAQREVGFPLLFILSGWPFTHSFIGITWIYAVLGVLMSVLVYWCVARASDTVAFYTAIVCILSLAPFTYLKFFYPDQCYTFFNLSAITLLVAFLWSGQFRFLYFFTCAAVAASFTRTAGNLMYPVLLAIAYATVRGRWRHYVSCAVIFVAAAGLYQWHRYDIFDMKHQPSTPSGKGMQILYSTYLYLGDFGYRLSPDMGPNTKRLFDLMHKDLQPTVRDSPLVKQQLGDSPKEFMEKYFYAYTPDQLIEKISTEPNEEYYWNVIQGVDTNDQFYLDIAKEIAWSHPWYVVQYGTRNLWHSLFDPGYATPRYSTIGFSKTGNDFVPETQGWGVRSEDPVTQYGEHAAREMEFFQRRSLPVGVQTFFDQVRLTWLVNYDAYVLYTSLLMMLAWVACVVTMTGWLSPNSSLGRFIASVGVGRLVPPVLVASALVVYEDVMTALFSQPVYRYFHMTEPLRLVIAGYGVAFLVFFMRRVSIPISVRWPEANPVVWGGYLSTVQLPNPSRMWVATTSASRSVASRVRDYDALTRYFGPRPLALLVWLVVIDVAAFGWWTSTLLANTRGPRAPEIVSASYGANCRVPGSPKTVRAEQSLDDVTPYVKKMCARAQGAQCGFVLDEGLIGDPAPGCDKDFSITYHCPSDDTTWTMTTRAGASGKTVAFSCSPIPRSLSTAADARRATDARVLMAALERYHDDYGSYPAIFLDNRISDLRKPLAGYLDRVPQDPVWHDGAKEYRYVSADGSSYALRLYPDGLNGKSCITGVGFAGKGWWGQQSECAF